MSSDAVVRYQTRYRCGAELLVGWGHAHERCLLQTSCPRLHGVFANTIFFETSAGRTNFEVWHCSRIRFFDSLKLWVIDSGEKGGTSDNTAILSEAFWQELQDHPIPVDAEVVRYLAEPRLSGLVYLAHLALLPSERARAGLHIRSILSYFSCIVLARSLESTGICAR